MSGVATTTKRKYALTKVAPGDYLLPSNDAQTVWRIRRYTDGPSAGLDLPRDREFWGVWRWENSVGIGGAVDIEAWDRWFFHEGLFDTRSEAIDAAMQAGG